MISNDKSLVKGTARKALEELSGTNVAKIEQLLQISRKNRNSERVQCSKTEESSTSEHIFSCPNYVLAFVKGRYYEDKINK